MDSLMCSVVPISIDASIQFPRPGRAQPCNKTADVVTTAQKLRCVGMPPLGGGGDKRVLQYTVRHVHYTRLVATVLRIA